MDSKKIKVWAHRGASGYAPENTMDAFRKAIEMKADGIELDVNLTKDGEVVVIHDEVLDRVSDGTGRVQDFTCNELKKFNFNKIHPEYEKEEIPTLEEVYQLIKPTDLTINVEMKTGNTFYPGMEDKVLELTKKYDMMDRIIVSSFNHYTIRSMKEKCPELKNRCTVCGWNYKCGRLCGGCCAGRCSASGVDENFLSKLSGGLQAEKYISACMDDQ